MCDEQKVAKGLIAGFLTGAILGSAIALLYAPKSGKELRQDISDKTSDLKDDLQKQYEVLKCKLSDLTSDAREKIDMAVDSAHKSFGDAKAKAQESGNKLTSAVKAGWEAGKDELTKEG